MLDYAIESIPVTEGHKYLPCGRYVGQPWCMNIVTERISEVMEAHISHIMGYCNKPLKKVLFEVLFVERNKCDCAKYDHFAVCWVEWLWIIERSMAINV